MQANLLVKHDPSFLTIFANASASCPKTSQEGMSNLCELHAEVSHQWLGSTLDCSLKLHHCDVDLRCLTSVPVRDAVSQFLIACSLNTNKILIRINVDINFVSSRRP